MSADKKQRFQYNKTHAHTRASPHTNTNIHTTTLYLRYVATQRGLSNYAYNASVRVCVCVCVYVAFSKFSHMTRVAACCMRRDSARGLSAANTDVLCRRHK